MITIKTLFISAFMFLKLSGPVVDPGNPECDNVNASVVVSFEEGKGGKAEVTAKGGVVPYKYVFYKPSGHLLSEEFDKNVVSKLEKGKYFCTVLDKKGCYTTIEIEIK